MDLDSVSVHKNAKKERGRNPAILTAQSLVSYMEGDLYFLVDKIAPFCPIVVTNHSAGFDSSHNKGLFLRTSALMNIQISSYVFLVIT